MQQRIWADKASSGEQKTWTLVPAVHKWPGFAGCPSVLGGRLWQWRHWVQQSQGRWVMGMCSALHGEKPFLCRRGLDVIIVMRCWDWTPSITWQWLNNHMMMKMMFIRIAWRSSGDVRFLTKLHRPRFFLSGVWAPFACFFLMGRWSLDNVQVLVSVPDRLGKKQKVFNVKRPDLLQLCR